MQFRLWRPASRRKFKTFGAYPFVVLLLAASVTASAHAHEGHEPAPPTSSTTASSLPRLTVESEAYQLVAVLKDGRFTIYLDRFEDNAPVPDAKITVMIDGEPVMAEPAPDGTYVLTSNLLSGRDSIELVFDIRAPGADDLLISRLSLPVPSGRGVTGPASWWGQAWSAVRDHPVLVIMTLVFGIGLGTALGLAPRYRRGFRLPVILVLTFPLALLVASNATAETAKKGANGGDVVVMENHPIEFVSKGQEITFYILDEDGRSPVMTAGLTGRAVIQDGGKTTAVNLSPAEPNRFVGQLQMPLGPHARIVFSAKVAGHNLQARFTTP
jgi:hypothetical protein